MFLLLVLTVSLLVSALTHMALVNSRLAKYFGDAPNHRKVHQQVIPKLGGISLIVAFGVALCLRTLVPGDVWPRSGNLLSGAFLFMGAFLAVVGTLDDIRNLDFRWKFIFQFMLAGSVVLVLGHHFGTVTVFDHRLELSWFGPLASIFWIVAVMNAFNIIDGIDGLAGGVAISGFGVVAYMAHISGSAYLLAMSVAFIGLILGFLRFNFSKQYKVFLGDSGSQFLGAVLALMALEVQRMPTSRHSVFVPLLIVGYPLFDISVAMARRFFKGGARRMPTRFMKMFTADNEHLHHRLVYLGLSHPQSSLLLVMLAATISVSAVLISMLNVQGRVAVLAYLASTLFLILNRLGYIGIKPWLTFPRSKHLPEKIVGVIEPDEVFFHSLKSFKQDKFDFLSLPGKLTKFLGDDLIAVMVYNATADKFEEKWSAALRASEIQDCPAIVIADASDINRVKNMKPEGFESIHFMEKPVRVPELIHQLERFTAVRANMRARPKERRFSLAEIALRNHERD